MSMVAEHGANMHPTFVAIWYLSRGRPEATRRRYQIECKVAAVMKESEDRCHGRFQGGFCPRRYTTMVAF